MLKIELTQKQCEEIAYKAIAYWKAHKCNESNPAMLLSSRHHPSVSDQCVRLMDEYFKTEKDLFKCIENIGFKL